MSYRLDNAKPRYDVAVIGSGLSGMTAANVLAKAGYKVGLFEHHYLFGGMATWFKRRPSHIFDISLHGFPYGMVKSIRKYWSRELSQSIVRLDRIRFDNPEFALDTTYDRQDFTRILIDHFKIPQTKVDEFFVQARNLTHLDQTELTTRQLFDRFFPNRTDVWRFLMEPITYANGSTLDEPALTYGIVFSNFMSKGVFTFRGGTDILVKQMLKILESNGVDLFNHANVEKIVVEQGRTKAIVVNGKQIEADCVISNAGLRNTTDNLIGKEHFSSNFLDEIHSVKVSTSSCQVYLGIRKGESIEDIGELFFTSTHPVYDSSALTAFHPSSRTYSFYYPKIRPGSDKFSIVASTNALWEDWAKLTENEYQIEKKRLIDSTVEALEGYLPGVSGKIDWKEASTPRTFVHYTKHFGGAVFGTKFEGLQVSTRLPDEVPGTFHAGSVGIIMSGWLGAINYGVIVANKADEFLQTERSSLTPTLKPEKELAQHAF